MEAGGQFIRGFRCGLDYAFILTTATGLQDAERVMPRLHRDILVPARKPKSLFSESMSLYRAGLKLALFLPLGVAMPPRGGVRFHRCELRFQSLLTK